MRFVLACACAHASNACAWTPACARARNVRERYLEDGVEIRRGLPLFGAELHGHLGAQGLEGRGETRGGMVEAGGARTLDQAELGAARQDRRGLRGQVLGLGVPGYCVEHCGAAAAAPMRLQ